MTDPGDCSKLFQEILKGPHADVLLREYNSLKYFTKYFKFEDNRDIYLCFTESLFTLFIISRQELITDTFLIKSRKSLMLGEMPSEFAFNINKRVILDVYPAAQFKSDKLLPLPIKEILTKTYGTYPINRDLKRIVIGKGGISITSKIKTDTKDLFNMLKSGEDLCRLLEVKDE
jgi:hypothetical protein